jgi:hypothetical protein
MSLLPVLPHRSCGQGWRKGSHRAEQPGCSAPWPCRAGSAGKESRALQESGPLGSTKCESIAHTHSHTRKHGHTCAHALHADITRRAHAHTCTQTDTRSHRLLSRVACSPQVSGPLTWHTSCTCDRGNTHTWIPGQSLPSRVQLVHGPPHTAPSPRVCTHTELTELSFRHSGEQLRSPRWLWPGRTVLALAASASPAINGLGATKLHSSEPCSTCTPNSHSQHSCSEGAGRDLG